MTKEKLQELLSKCKTQKEMVKLINREKIKGDKLSVSGLNFILDKAYTLPKE